MEQRRAEIEAKKAKLADLRRQREQRLHMAQQSLASDASLSPSRSAVDRRSDIDKLVASLVGSSRSQSRLDGEHLASAGQENNEPFIDTPPLLPRKASAAHSDLSTVIITMYDAPPVVPMELGENQACGRATKEIITYSKEVQTAESFLAEELQFELPHPALLSATCPGQFQEEIRERLRREIKEEFQLESGDSPTMEKEPLAPRMKIKDLQPEEKSELLQSEEFFQFIERSSKIVERALDDDYDILVDYASDLQDKHGSDAEGGVKQLEQFSSDRWSTSRTITAIDWSQKYSELFLAAYSKNSQSIRDPLGIIQVWNTHLRDRPEYIFHSQSDILSCKFSPFHPNLIVGGCYNGQVLVWDIRAKSEAILKSPLTGTGHSHPVYSIEFVGTKNATSIISSSTDGRVCGWNADFLAQPHEVHDFKLQPPSRTEDLAPTALGFQATDPSYFLVGSEDGNIYTCNRSVRAGAKAGLDLSTIYHSHPAPVSSLSFHPPYGPLDLSDLVLSSSLDWTLKLWRVRKLTISTTNLSKQGIKIDVPSVGTPSSSASSMMPNMIEPLMEFSSDDAVYDVAWNPVRPAVFASVGCAGKVDIWDLSEETEVPITSTRPAIPSGTKCQALNKVAWEKTDGKLLAVGGLSSVITVFEVGDNLGGAANARSEEWRHMRRLVSQAEKRSSNTDPR
ncbi:WD40-repeat-containing domain protein [Lipomyces chichibuensis]|uniref:WD40-repeat-containing domain protein n=1 Tax=Lipomyces chichibuensis TaxID=1546026 RepID=UPI0033432CC0